MNDKVNFPASAVALNAELLDSVKQFDSKSLYWLSGYCSGLADGKGQSTFNTEVVNSTNSVSQPAVELNTLVLFASQSGNSEKVARQLHERLSGASIQADIASVSDFKPKTLKEKQIILMVTSTHGEGEPPDDAIDFHEFILGKRAPKLEGSQHAVLSLGDSSYEFFCQTGKDFDQAFSKLGSKPLVERVDCDLDFESDANSWIDDVVAALARLSNSSQAPAAAKSNSSLQQAASSEWSKTNPFTATILDNQKITGRGSIKKIHHIEISIEGSGIQYAPGDSLGIWAKNNAQIVEKILELTSLTGTEEVEVKGEERTVKQALEENLEITLLNKAFIADYATLTNNQTLTKVANDSFAEYIQNHQVIDVIEVAPFALEAQQLVDLLKPIKPRMYSIASSLEANPDEVHLTVALAESENENAKRLGVASQFLIETLQTDDQVLVFVEPNKHFKLAEPTKPILMIGPGTGVAPFRAFLQEREEQQAEGQSWLFFGNPNFNTDFLYQVEFQAFLKNQTLNNLSVAFSRDQAEKIYVQDRLIENAEAIWKWINEMDAHIYVCGDMNRMAKDVESALLTIIQQQGAKTAEEAELYLKSLRKDKRYQRDVY